MNQAELVEHYRSLLKKHSASPQAVQWADEATQIARFEVLAQGLRGSGSVLDIGCGLAGFCHFLRKQGDLSRQYHGVDIVPEFADLANRSLSGDPLASAGHLSIGGSLPKRFDYAVISGVFNNKMADNWSFMTSMLEEAFDSCDKGVLFNAMSSFVDYKDSGLFYVDPLKLFEFCKEQLKGHVTLRHDYCLQANGFPFEFAMYVYKEPLNVSN